MELKLDFFTLPELRKTIYPNLSVSENARLQCVSKDIKAEIMEYFCNYYKQSNNAAFDILSRFYIFDKSTHKLIPDKSKTAEIEWIKNNVIFQQFLHDDYFQYISSTLCLGNYDPNLGVLAENQIWVELHTMELASKIEIAAEICLNLLLAKKGESPPSPEEYSRWKNTKMDYISRKMVSYQSEDEALEGVLKRLINASVDGDLSKQDAAFALYKFKTTEIKCTTPGHRGHIKCIIPNASHYNWSKPLTLEQLQPHESEIKNRLGKKSVEQFINEFLNNNTKTMFNYPDIQSCYANGKISHKHMLLFIYNRPIPFFKKNNCTIDEKISFKNMVSVVKQTWLQLDWLTKLRNNIDFSQYLLENPDEMIYLNNAADRKQILSILDDCYGYLPLLTKKRVTLQECTQFGNSLHNAENFLYATYFCDPKKATRHEIELFCEGLGSPEQYSKGLAIKALQKHGKDLQAEKKTIEYWKAGFFAKIENGFSKLIYGDIREAKYQAINALIAVLRKTPNSYLSETQIDVLTDTLGTEDEDPLATIVRTTLLNPLQIMSLHELNPDFADMPHKDTRIVRL